MIYTIWLLSAILLATLSLLLVIKEQRANSPNIDVVDEGLDPGTRTPLPVRRQVAFGEEGRPATSIVARISPSLPLP